MSEPTRLREEATALERALLDAGSAYRGSPTARAKTLGALGLAGSATLMTATAAKAPLASAGNLSLGKAALGKLTWGKLLAGAAICGAVAAVPAGYRAWQHREMTGHAGRASAVVAPEVPPAAEAPGPVGAGAPAAPLAPFGAAVGPAQLAPPEATPLHRRRAAEGAASVPLARELASIDAARAALGRGDADGALARLDRYARKYPRGRLDLEAEVLRIDALAQSGRADTARAHAREFLRRHPNSVLAAHVRTRLGD